MIIGSSTQEHPVFRLTATLFAELMNKAKEKKTFVYSSSVDELFDKLERFDWSEIRAEVERKIVFKVD